MIIAYSIFAATVHMSGLVIKRHLRSDQTKRDPNSRYCVQSGAGHFALPRLDKRSCNPLHNAAADGGTEKIMFCLL